VAIGLSKSGWGSPVQLAIPPGNVWLAIGKRRGWASTYLGDPAGTPVTGRYLYGALVRQANSEVEARGEV